LKSAAHDLSSSVEDSGAVLLVVAVEVSADKEVPEVVSSPAVEAALRAVLAEVLPQRHKRGDDRLLLSILSSHSSLAIRCN
jgi:hypothetical protein